MQRAFCGCSLPCRGVLQVIFKQMIFYHLFKIIKQVTSNDSSRIFFRCPNFRFFLKLCNICPQGAHSLGLPFYRAQALQCPRAPLAPSPVYVSSLAP